MEKFKAKLRYQFDNLMSRGAVALVGILFLATTIVIVVASLIAFLLGQGSIGENIWASLMHTIDAGTITAADTSNGVFVVLMSIVTLCGIFITSILIGIITTGFEEKLNSLKKGNSQVIESDHTVILGFDENIYTIISELAVANESRKDAAIVVLSPTDKEEMEEAIANQVPDLKTTRVICRTGSITDISMLKKCSVDNCRSVILNERRDFITIKAILAINHFFNSSEEMQLNEKPPIVALINEKRNFDAAMIAGEGNVEALLARDSISRIIAQTCRQPGLSNVLIDLFDFDGCELYFENYQELAGKKFGDILNLFVEAVPFGYKRGDDIRINPPMDDVLELNDQIIILAEDDGVAVPKEYEHKDLTKLLASLEKQSVTEPESILILGVNSMLPLILKELDDYFSSSSSITVACMDESVKEEQFAGQFNNIDLRIMHCDINSRDVLDSLTEEKVEHVLLLSNDENDVETSDAMTLLKLIHLRDIAQGSNKKFNITSEMLSTTNQKLAKVTNINDLVVGSNIVNLIMTQISENRHLARVFKELLEAEGSEIYIRKASYYVPLSEPVDFHMVSETARLRGEIALGYKMSEENGTFSITVNPTKSDILKFEAGDGIIVLAQD